uniref:DUF885 domain-containing protein n=1 Tax=Timspurckia oligopyrenoides TaxID=708627 RepID=A0A7S0ZF37_9RHOD|mmetsp:Transcript_2715/g.4774  ORF Transcript_2715/g.4774 Transcript_2715/m.4774 type:complete len:616 (+) Transcript_2715:52-1899(+)
MGKLESAAITTAAGVLLLSVWKRIHNHPEAHGRHTSDAQSSASIQLQKLYERLWDLQMSDDPIVATMLGDYRFDSCLADLSQKGRKHLVSGLRSLLRDLKSVDYSQLNSPNDQQNHTFLFQLLNMEITAKTTFDIYEFPTNHVYGPHLLFSQVPALHPWRSVHDTETYVARLKCFKKQVEDMIECCQSGIRTKVTLPIESVDAIVAQCRSQVDLGANDVSKSPFYSSVALKFQELGGDLEGLRNAIKEIVIQGYSELGNFFEREYRKHARRSPGLCSINGGEKMYRGALKYFTSMDYSPEELYQLGLREVKRIKEEIRKVRKELLMLDPASTQISNDLSLPEFLEVLERNPKLFPDSRGSIISRYESILKRAHDRIPQYFHIIPAAELSVKPVEPFREESAPSAHYFPSPADRSRPATFYANTWKASTRPFYMMEAIALHEGVPGHHLQISIAQELEGMPRIRRQIQGFCISYTEGWALYSEYLGEVMDFYTQPIHMLGRLLVEIWRAARLVIDTGIHAFGWSREQAVRYLSQSAGIPEADVQAEVDRYMVLPGQACAYKVGELKILELKDLAMDKLGTRFSWKEFHDVVLRNGAVPLPMLDENVNHWIRECREK